MKSDTSKATARPWRITEGATLRIESATEDKPIAKVSQCQMDGGAVKTLGECLCNAQLIVQAVNQFDALNAVAKAAESLMLRVSLSAPKDSPAQIAGERLGEALSALQSIRQ